MAYIRKYPSPPRFRLRSLALTSIPYRSYFFVSDLTTFFYTGFRGQFSGIRQEKKSSSTQGNIFHEFEGTQSRVSINRSDGLNFKKYRIPDWTEQFKSSLELHFTNSLLYGAFNKLLGPGSGEISGDLTPNQC